MEKLYMTQWISVARGRWVQGGENQERSQKRGNLLHFFHLWEWAVDHQSQQFMNLRTGMLGLWGGNHCWNVHRKGQNLGLWSQASVSFHVIGLLQGFLRRRWLILLLVSWPSSPFFFLKINVNFWHETLFTDFFQHLFLIYHSFQVTVHHPSLPGPGEV